MFRVQSVSQFWVLDVGLQSGGNIVLDVYGLSRSGCRVQLQYSGLGVFLFMFFLVFLIQFMGFGVKRGLGFIKNNLGLQNLKVYVLLYEQDRVQVFGQGYISQGQVGFLMVVEGLRFFKLKVVLGGYFGVRCLFFFIFIQMFLVLYNQAIWIFLVKQWEEALF